jgi:hypothetical protein
MASTANPITTIIPAIIGHGNCFLVAVALSPDFASSGSLGGRFGCVAILASSFETPLLLGFPALLLL